MRPLHLSDRPSATAQLVAVWRALELDRDPRERIVSDEYAPLFLDATGRAAVRAARLGRPVVAAVERHRPAGIITHVLCRHAYLDDQLLAHLDDGADQVVVLGAGYDSRAYRFARELTGRPLFEVDLPPLSQHKAALVAARPDAFPPTTMHRVEIDFRTQSLADRLQQNGFRDGARTFVVWEGVVPYLSAEAITNTLDALGELCGPGSAVALDAWDGVGGDDRYQVLRRIAAQGLSLLGEPVAFGLRTEAMADFLAERGWPATDVVPAAELTDRYATGGRSCDPSLYVLTATRSDP